MPYCIVTYDVEEGRVNQVRKVLKRYFTWVQNSVFEGEIGDGKLEKCLQELKKVIKSDADSIYVYRFELQGYCQKRVLGQEKEKPLNLIS
ncbi:CRISPR-associated endonuclease Cas2 [Candidatus Caldatribacterium sp. SIUC1]|jgi:CRISPR-associated protein Cas2|uniref:CRISPR-associated endonuclease Cas2 n=1 Tax=Candidatus Caldatribacterium sp. SIUC1 TaxID=3418365 RepID=UPI003F68D696